MLLICDYNHENNSNMGNIMNKKLLLVGLFTISGMAFSGIFPPLIQINGVFNGPIPSAPPGKSNANKGLFTVPDMIELYVVTDGDLGACAFSVTNAGAFPADPIALPTIPVTAGDYFYITNDPSFTGYFGFLANQLLPPLFNFSGGDRVELYCDGILVDVYGEFLPPPTAKYNKGAPPWMFSQGWAHRNPMPPTKSDANEKGGVPIFNLAEWSLSGVGAVSACITNDACPARYPIGTLPVELMNFSVE